MEEKDVGGFCGNSNEGYDANNRYDDETAKPVKEEERKSRSLKKDIRVLEQLQNVGYSVIRLADQVEEDDYGKVGLHTEEQFRKYGTGMLDLLGSGATYRYLKEKANKNSGLINAYEREIAKNRISFEDIIQSEDLYKILKTEENHNINESDLENIYGATYTKWKLSEPPIDNIELHEEWIKKRPIKEYTNRLKGHNLKDAQYIHDSILAHRTLKEFAESDIGQKLLDADKKDFILNQDFYDLSNKHTRGMREKIISIYMKNSTDPMLREIPITLLSDKKYKRLLKKSDTFEFTEQEKSLLRIYDKDRKIRRAKRASHKEKRKSRRFFLSEIKGKSIDKQSMEYAGINTVQKIVTTARATKSCIKVGLIGGRWIGRNIIIRPAVAIAKKIGLTKKLNASKVGKAYKRTREKINTTKRQVQKTVQMPAYLIKRNASALGKSVIKSKAATPIVKTAKIVARPIKTIARPIHIIAKPFRFIMRVRNKLKATALKIKIAIGATIAILVILYIALVFISSYLITSLNAFKEEATTTVYTEDENQLELIRDMVTALDDTRLEECVEYANDNHTIHVSGGQTVNHYGSLDHSDFYKINYLDGNGYNLGNKISNIKDLICITCVVFQYDMSDTEVINKFIEDLYYILCPDPVYVESEVYYCSAGCSTYDYECDDSGAYSTMNSWFADGVHKYGNIAPQTASGCQIDYYSCDGHTSTIIDPVTNLPVTFTTYCGSHMSSPCSNCTTHRKCPGHSVILCYGHRDLEINNTLYFKEDLYENTISLPSNPIYQDIVDSFIEDGGFDFYSSWIDSLYNQDWYELYGFDVNGGVGFNPDQEITSEEAAEILAGLNTTQARLDIVNYALSYVGKIQYYWGGKATCKGWDGNNFGVLCTPDRKGRNHVGLDCSGFVGWVIWSVTDIDAHYCGTSTMLPVIGGHRISASELQPGDLAFQNTPGAAENHVGIYAGKDENGNMMWVHCNANTNNVSYNHVTYWKYYWRWID